MIIQLDASCSGLRNPDKNLESILITYFDFSFLQQLLSV